MSKIEYRITNITKWPGVPKGKHKHGFILAIHKKNLHVGKTMVVPDMTEALEGMQSKKWLKIEAIKDRHVLVKEQVAKTEAENLKDLAAMTASNEKVAASQVQKIKQDKDAAIKEFQNTLDNPEPAHNLDKDAIRASLNQSMTSGKAVVSDGEQEGNDPLDGLESAVDPDGEPNFVVKAGNHRTQGNKKR